MALLAIPSASFVPFFSGFGHGKRPLLPSRKTARTTRALSSRGSSMNRLTIPEQQLQRALNKARMSNSTKSRRISFAAAVEADHIVAETFPNATLEEYMSIDPSDYVTFDEKIMSRTADGGFHFEYPISLLKGVDVRLVCDLAVSHDTAKKTNTWTGSIPSFN